jgi:hypothetical protein
MSVLKKMSFIMRELGSLAFQIESCDEDTATGLLYFWVKIVGKCTPPIKIDPIDLLKEARSNKQFSEADFNWAMDSMLENQKRIIERKYKNTYALIKHQFSEQLEEPLIVYSDRFKKIHIQPAKEVHCNIEKIKKFSSEDSACIGYIVGCYETEKEYKIRQKTKRPNTIKFDI